MKKIILLLMLGMAVVSACKKDKSTSTSNKSQEQLLLGKWTLENVGVRNPFDTPEVINPPSNPSTWDFISLTQIKLNNNTIFDYWLENGEITIISPGTIPYVIKTLNETTLIVDYDNFPGGVHVKTTYYFKK
jgi:hypothetical protein